MANSTLTVKRSHIILLSRVFLFDHTIRAKLLLRPPKNPNLPLRSPAKVALVRESHVPPVFWLRVPFQHYAAVFYPLFLGLFGAVLLLVSNAAAKVQLFEGAANGSSGDFDVEACSTWNSFLRKSRKRGIP